MNGGRVCDLAERNKVNFFFFWRSQEIRIHVGYKRGQRYDRRLKIWGTTLEFATTPLPFSQET